ncbi:MAG TPA: SRPBCC domain-containing protein [Bacteroidia bacterium]
MKKASFSIKINASKEKVWNALWTDANYREWTKVFCEGSYAVSDWKEGSKILFLAGDQGGMYSTITKKVPHECMFFTHIGMVKDNVELPVDEETKKWTGATENYTLTEKDGVTELLVNMDITEEHYNYFKDAFPKGLEKVKAIAENQVND